MKVTGLWGTGAFASFVVLHAGAGGCSIEEGHTFGMGGVDNAGGAISGGKPSSERGGALGSGGTSTGRGGSGTSAGSGGSGTGGSGDSIAGAGAAGNGGSDSSDGGVGGASGGTDSGNDAGAAGSTGGGGDATSGGAGGGGGDGTGVTCPSDQHICDNRCVPNNDVRTCGARCTPCPAAPANADATCVQGTCGFACKAGYTGKSCEFPRLLAIPFSVALSDDGSIVGGSTVAGVGGATLNGVASRWLVGSVSPTAASGVPMPGYVSGMSGNGQVLVGGLGGGLDSAFRWSAQGAEQLPLPDPNGIMYATAANRDGSTTVGYYYDSNSAFAYFWKLPGTTYTRFPQAPYDEAYAGDVSDDGLIAVGSVGYLEQDDYPAWFTQSSMTTLSNTPGSAWTISGDGRVIVGTAGTAVRWSGPGYTTAQPLNSLPSTGAVSSKPNRTNIDGSVVVGYGRVSGSATAAVIWDSAGAVRKISDILAENAVNLTGWNLTEAMDVSADGKVVIGRGTFNGADTPWLARLP